MTEIELNKKESKKGETQPKILTIAELLAITKKIDLIDSYVQEIEELNATVYHKKLIKLGSSIAVTLPNKIVLALKLIAGNTINWIQIDKDKLFLYVKK